VFETLRAGSSLALSWGTFTLVRRGALLVRHPQQLGRAWAVGPAVFIWAGILSAAYLTTYLTLAFAWESFVSLNSIVDIADRRIHLR
jgi:hypothetical protein